MYHFWYINTEAQVTKERAPEVPVRFYRSAAGREPVIEWLRSLDREDRRAIGLDLMRVANRHSPCAEPERRPLGVTISSAKPEDSSFDTCFHQKTVIVLHGFIKKTQKTSTEDLELAKGD